MSGICRCLRAWMIHNRLLDFTSQFTMNVEDESQPKLTGDIRLEENT